MVCDQCSERASMMHCHLYQVSTCSVCAGIHLYNLSQQHIVVTFPNQNTVVDTQDIEINDAVSSQNESRINRLLQCEPCIIQSKKLNSGAIRSLPPSSNTGEWWISFHKNCEDQTMSIKLGPKPDDNTVTKKGNLTYTYLKSKEKKRRCNSKLVFIEQYGSMDRSLGQWYHKSPQPSWRQNNFNHTRAHPRRYNSDKDREFNIYLLQTQYMY